MLFSFVLYFLGAGGRWRGCFFLVEIWIFCEDLISEMSCCFLSQQCCVVTQGRRRMKGVWREKQCLSRNPGMTFK